MNISQLSQETIAPPLFVSAAALRGLDGALERCRTIVEGERERLVSEAVAKEMATYSYSAGLVSPDEVRKRVQTKLASPVSKRHLVLSGKRYATVETFSAAVNDPIFDSENIVGFSASVTLGEVRASVEINGSDELEIECRPEGFTTARQLLTILRDWSEAVEAHWIRRVSYSDRFLFYLLLIGLIALPAIQSWWSVPSTTERRQASAIVEGGVQASEIPQAMEMLLRRAYGLDRMPALGVSLLAAMIALFFLRRIFLPAVVIEVRGSRRRYKFWVWLDRFLFFTVPGWLLLMAQPSLIEYLVRAVGFRQ